MAVVTKNFPLASHPGKFLLPTSSGRGPVSSRFTGPAGATGAAGGAAAGFEDFLDFVGALAGAAGATVGSGGAGALGSRDTKPSALESSSYCILSLNARLAEKTT